MLSSSTSTNVPKPGEVMSCDFSDKKALISYFENLITFVDQPRCNKFSALSYRSILPGFQWIPIRLKFKEKVTKKN